MRSGVIPADGSRSGGQTGIATGRKVGGGDAKETLTGVNGAFRTHPPPKACGFEAEQAMLLETEEGIWARADATVFKLLMDGGRTERRLQAARRTVAAAHQRVATLRRLRGAADARAHRATECQIEQELRASWGKPLHIKVPRLLARYGPPGGEKRRAVLKAGAAPRAIRAYKAPLVDGRGRIALYFRVRYLGLKSKSWRPGLAAEHALYILRERAMENGEIALDLLPLSNMGKDADEIAACWKALEAVEEGYRANAKVQYRIVWNLPHDLSAAERREMVKGFCERTFGRLGLPWVAGIHKADQRGDQRNFHAHICFSTRPCERTGDHQWAIAQEKVNGLTDEDGLKLMRALAAGHMNIACRDAGLAVCFTHQTYKERGIDAERQEHVGLAAMAAHEAGERVAVIERNAARVAANELAAERDRIARALVSADRLVAIERARVDAADAGRMIARVNVRARTVAASAARMAATVLARSAPVGPVSKIRALATKATTMRDILVQSPRRLRAQAQATAAASASVAARAKNVVGLSGADQARSALRDAREYTARFSRRQAERAAVREAQAKAVILTTPLPPYEVSEGRATVDFSALTPGDRTLVLELNPAVRLATMRERIRRDHEERQKQHRRERERMAREEQELAARQADSDRRALEQRRLDGERRREAAEAEASRRAQRERTARAEHDRGARQAAEQQQTEVECRAEERRRDEAAQSEAGRSDEREAKGASREQAAAEDARRMQAEADHARRAQAETDGLRSHEQKGNPAPTEAVTLQIQRPAGMGAETAPADSGAMERASPERLRRRELARAGALRERAMSGRGKPRRDQPARPSMQDERGTAAAVQTTALDQPAVGRRTLPPGFNPADIGR